MLKKRSWPERDIHSSCRVRHTKQRRSNATPLKIITSPYIFDWQGSTWGKFYWFLKILPMSGSHLSIISPLTIRGRKFPWLRGLHIISRRAILSTWFCPFWKGVCSRKKEFTPNGSRFVPFIGDPFSEGTWCAGSKWEFIKVVSLIQNGGKSTRCSHHLKQQFYWSVT